MQELAFTGDIYTLVRVIAALESIRLSPSTTSGRPAIQLFDGMEGERLSIADTIVLAGKVALEHAGARHLSVPAAAAMAARGYSGTWAANNETDILSNAYFAVLLDHEWTRLPANGGMTESDPEYRSTTDRDRYMTHSDLAIRHDPILRAIAMEYAADNEAFLREFGRGWTRLMNADRFDGPAANLCDEYGSLLSRVAA
eukprot:scaffold647985_cov44-Prasinocladus_malaysianus.AAC.2